jgi:hypothetical protein
MSGRRIIAFACWATTLAAPAAAQTSLQIPLQFDFLSPGARSLALGGAFVSVADDATAGFTNPAGLTELSAAEVSIEGRARTLDSRFLERGRLSGAPFNEKTDTIAGAVFGTSRDSNAGLAFASAVFPIRRPWIVGAFRHELVRVDQSFVSQGVFQQDPTEITSRRDSPQTGDRSISITGYGVVAARRLGARVNAGATLTVYRFRLESIFRRYDVDGFLGPPIFTTEMGRSTQSGRDTTVSPTLGVQYCVPSCEDRARANVRVGAVYRFGPRFSYETVDGDLPRRTRRFRVPDVFAVGASYERPIKRRAGAAVGPGPSSSRRDIGRLVVLTEITAVRYSRLYADFVSDQALASGQAGNVSVDNGIEAHVGAQYTVQSRRWRYASFRAGFWSDPDHSVKYHGDPGADNADARLRSERLAVALSTGSRVSHVTGGIGLAVHPRLDWNLGADFASSVTAVSTSIIVKLKQGGRP